ncbi:MAG: hypothetical protein ABIK09_00385 [Pseudomonadota bacterium]
MRHACLLLLCLVCAAPAVGQESKTFSFWSIRERVDALVVPGCREVCEHTLGLLRAGLPQKEAMALQKGSAGLMKECVPSCETDLDTMERRCLITAVDMDAFERCKAESEARRAPPPALVEIAAPPPPLLPPAPDCEAVCLHILEMAVMQIPSQGGQSTPSQIEVYLPQCVVACVADLDEEARRCFMVASTTTEGEACDEALEARRPPPPDPNLPFYEEAPAPEVR